MTLRINTNVASLNAHRSLINNDLAVSKSLEKLSSGLRINRASDDAAGLSISETMRAQVAGLNQASRNAQDGISLLNTAEGALDEVSGILQRMRELAVQSANGTLTNSDRAANDAEFQSLRSEIDAISTRTQFNNQSLLASSVTTFTFQIGANNGQSLGVSISGVSSGSLNLGSSSTSSSSNANTAITSLDTAISTVSTIRSSVGAVTNRLEHSINSLGVASENTAAAQSRIRDVDMASEMSNLTRRQILQQSSTAMLAQANQSPQSILSLFK